MSPLTAWCNAVVEVTPPHFAGVTMDGPTPRRGGGGLVLNYAWICVSKSEGPFLTSRE